MGKNVKRLLTLLLGVSLNSFAAQHLITFANNTGMDFGIIKFYNKTNYETYLVNLKKK